MNATEIRVLSALLPALLQLMALALFPLDIVALAIFEGVVLTTLVLGVWTWWQLTAIERSRG